MASPSVNLGGARRDPGRLPAASSWRSTDRSRQRSPLGRESDRAGMTNAQHLVGSGPDRVKREPAKSPDRVQVLDSSMPADPGCLERDRRPRNGRNRKAGRAGLRPPRRRSTSDYDRLVRLRAAPSLVRLDESPGLAAAGSRATSGNHPLRCFRQSSARFPLGDIRSGGGSDPRGAERRVPFLEAAPAERRLVNRSQTWLSQAKRKNGRIGRFDRKERRATRRGAGYEMRHRVRRSAESGGARSPAE